ncbi:MAG: hypothetical protein H7Z13_19640 [Ferruginibacter sp.]|nr:hypothetical protein [Ferruginibacter sp.]
MMKKLLNYSPGFLLLLLSSDLVQSQSINVDWKTAKGKDGFFRVAKTQQGQWWFLMPDSTPFYYKGVCAVNRAGTAGGRRAIPGIYAETIDRKYNYQQNPDLFVHASLSKLRALGFNALGAWATEEFFNKGMPFTEIIEFFKEPPFLPSVSKREGLPDIFDPSWMIAADKKARALCSPLRNAKELVGYFTDNEIGFGKTDDTGLDLGFEAGQFDFTLLRTVLGMDSSKAAFKSAWSFLLNSYGQSFEKLSGAWGVSIATVLDIRKLNDNKAVINSKSYDADAEAFSKFYAEHYFSVTSQLISRYDPNHLILGCRFGAPPPLYVLDAMKPWTDVISVNNYRPTLYDRYDTLYKYAQLPLLVGEISWNTDLFKHIPFASEVQQPLSVKERMFRAGSATLQRAAMHDGIVGITWYRWVQGVSVADRFFDGVVNYNDEPDVHKDAHKILLPTLDSLRKRANDGKWKSVALVNGEMNLFFDSLRPGWDQPLRIEISQSKPLPHAFGWKMKGSFEKFSFRGNQLEMKLAIDFEEAPGRSGNTAAGKGVYTIQLLRNGEKWAGTYNGIYNGSKLAGKIYAFYFPDLK